MGDKDTRDRDIGHLEGQVEHLLDEIAQVNRLLLGDGQPGFISRMSDLELRIQEAVVRMDCSTAAVTAMQNTLTTHIANKNVHPTLSSLLRGKTAGFLILIFVALHTFLESGQDWVVQYFIKLLGG